MKRTVAVVGTSEANDVERAVAREVGLLLAQHGFAVVCGGHGGVMAAVCEGAKAGGGLTIGILPGCDRLAANPYVDVAIPTGLGEARNAIIALAGHAVIAVGGGLGTLSEIALALRAGRLVVGLGTWELDRDRAAGAPFVRAATPREAVELVLAQAARG